MQRMGDGIETPHEVLQHAPKLLDRLRGEHCVNVTVGEIGKKQAPEEDIIADDIQNIQVNRER